MKNFQIRISDEIHRTLRQIAKARRISIADVVREALEIYAIGVIYSQEGKNLVWEDPKTGDKIQLLIPGFSRAARNATVGPLINKK
jgi:hypothetical protein